MINLALGGGALLGGFLYGSHFGAVILGGAIGMGFALLVTVLLVAETKPARRIDGAPPRPPSSAGGPSSPRDTGWCWSTRRSAG